MIMSNHVYNGKIAKAKQRLLDHGLIAPDGSGDPDVEALLVLLSLFKAGKLELI